MLELEDTLIIYAGSNLQIINIYQTILSVKIGDFFDVQQSFIFIQFSDKDPVISDGSSEYNPSRLWPPAPGSRKVQEILEKRHTIARNALENSRTELRNTKEFINEALRNLAASCNHIPTVQESSIHQTLKQGCIKFPTT